MIETSNPMVVCEHLGLGGNSIQENNTSWHFEVYCLHRLCIFIIVTNCVDKTDVNFE